MIGVLRVKTKAPAVFISKPFQTQDKKIFDTDSQAFVETLCKLDKFSYFVIFVMYNFMSRKY